MKSLLFLIALCGTNAFTFTKSTRQLSSNRIVSGSSSSSSRLYENFGIKMVSGERRSGRCKSEGSISALQGREEPSKMRNARRPRSAASRLGVRPYGQRGDDQLRSIVCRFAPRRSRLSGVLVILVRSSSPNFLSKIVASLHVASIFVASLPVASHSVASLPVLHFASLFINTHTFNSRTSEPLRKTLPSRSSGRRTLRSSLPLSTTTASRTASTTSSSEHGSWIC